MSTETQDWEQTKELFHTALELRPDARRSFLEQKSSSPEVRAHVEKLLQAHEAADSFLERNVIAGEAWEPSSHPPRLADGTLLVERFEIVRFIARGGMGEVYEARDLELQSRVAIKTIRPEIAAIPSVLARFKREVQLARQVTHPNVCRLFDIFRHRDPLHPDADVVFVSMELVNGNTLAERIKNNGRMNPDEVVAILRQVVPALGAAHEAGILHRDLKPGNILLESGRDHRMRAVITDFGLAWSLESNADTPLSMSGQPTFGTPEYMSPEQIEGKPLTPASDLYSLGLVTYRLLTGTKAFGQDTPLMAALRRINETPPPPSHLIPELGSRWDNLIAQCLNPDPTHRFASASQLLNAIEAPLRGEVRLTVANPQDQARWSLQKRWPWIAATLAVATAGTAALVLFLHWHKPSPASIRYVLADFVNTTGEPIFDHTLNLALGAKLQQTPYLDRLPDAKIRTGLEFLGLPANQRLTESVAMQVCQRQANSTVLQGSIKNGPQGYIVSLRAMDCHTGKLLAMKEVTSDRQESVLHALDRAAEGIRPALGESLASIQRYDVPLWEATTPSLEALTAFTDGFTEWNTKGEVPALADFERAVQLDPNFALSWARMGTVYGNIGETQKSIDALTRAYELRNRGTEWERYYIVSHYYAFVTGEIDKEMQTYEAWAQAYPHDMAWTINLSVDYSIMGNYDKAIDLQQRAIREAPGNAPSYGDLAQLYLAIDHPDEARAILDEGTQLHLSDANIEMAEYSLAFYTSNTIRMKSLLDGVEHRAGIEDMLLSQQAATEDREGRVSQGQALSRKASAAAQQAGDTEVSANLLAVEAKRQVLLGDNAAALRLVDQAMAVPKASQGEDVQVLAGLVFAETGNLPRARKLMTDLSHAHPSDTIVQHYWIPILRARIALTENHPEAAINLLNGTEPYDLGIFEPGQCMDAAYLRGEAWLSLHQATAAIGQFRNILAHRGLVLNCPTSALAQLGIARALTLAGDTAGSRAAYQDILALWKDADPNFQLAKQAQSEYRSLR